MAINTLMGEVASGEGTKRMKWMTPLKNVAVTITVIPVLTGRLFNLLGLGLMVR